MSQEGNLWKRGATNTMEQAYCLLIGTLLWDFPSQEDMLNGAAPTREVVIIGVSEWDGKGQMHQFDNGFVFVTLLGVTYHASAPTAAELSAWVRAIRHALQLYFLTVDKNSADFLENNVKPQPVSKVGNKTCPLSDKTFSHFERGEVCNSCGSIVAQEYCTKMMPLTQHGYQAAQKVCDRCYMVQKFLMHLKMVNGFLRLGWGEISALKGDLGRGCLKLMAEAMQNPSRRVSDSLAMFADGIISESDMETLIQSDWKYEEDKRSQQIESFQSALKFQGVDVLGLIQKLAEKSCPLEDFLQFHVVIESLSQLAEQDLDIIDFFWPQLVHLHYLLLPVTSWEQLLKVEILEDFFLSFCLRSGLLAVKLIWALKGYLEDLYANLDQRAMRLILLSIEVESILVGFDAFAGSPYHFNSTFRHFLQPTLTQHRDIILQLRTLHQHRHMITETIPGISLPAKLHLYHPYRGQLSKGTEQQDLFKNAHSLQNDDNILKDVRLVLFEIVEKIEMLSAQTRQSEQKDSGEKPAKIEVLSNQKVQNQASKPEQINLRNNPASGETLSLPEVVPSAPATESLKKKPPEKGLPPPYPVLEALNISLEGSDTGSDDGIGLGPPISSKPKLKGKFKETKKSNTKKKAFSVNLAELNPCAQFFIRQLRFIKKLGEIAEKLSLIDPADKDARKKMLVKELTKFGELQETIAGYLPLCSASEPECPIVRIPCEEGHVFRTKARAPTLIVFEVIRPKKMDADEKTWKTMYSARHGNTIIFDQEKITELIGTQIHEQMEEVLRNLAAAETDVEENGSSMFPVQPLTPSSVKPSGEPEKDHVNQRSERLRSNSADNSMLRKASFDSSTLRTFMNDFKEGFEAMIPDDVVSLKKKIHDFKDMLPSMLNNSTNCRPSNKGLLKDSAVRFHPTSSIASVDVLKTIKKIDSSGTISSTIAEEYDMDLINESIHSTTHRPAFLRQSSAVKNAQQLYQKNEITKIELLECIQKDVLFQVHLEETANQDKQFNVALAFGESWGKKQARIKLESPMGSEAGWELHSLIVKSNDDLRQEVMTIQMIELCRHIFQEAGINLWLRPYRILSTSSSTGLIETISDAMSLDALKKREGYVSLLDHFERTYGAENTSQRIQAQKNFVASLAAYSLVCYFFQIKDRHNGNILLDSEGHLVHIDFGFILGIAPGGYFSTETCPFKLTAEMVEVLGGWNVKSRWFNEFSVGFTCGFLALREQADRITSLVEIMSRASIFPCFAGKDKAGIIKSLRERFRTDLDKEEVVSHCLELIKTSFNNYGMRQYDNFQWYTNGIMS